MQSKTCVNNQTVLWEPHDHAVYTMWLLLNNSQCQIVVWLSANGLSRLAVPRRLFCYGSLVILDVVCSYLLLYINIEIGNNRC